MARYADILHTAEIIHPTSIDARAAVLSAIGGRIDEIEEQEHGEDGITSTMALIRLKPADDATARAEGIDIERAGIRITIEPAA